MLRAEPRLLRAELTTDATAEFPMTDSSPRIVCVGEVMIEMTRGRATAGSRCRAAATPSTRRCTWPAPAKRPAYATALGDDDPYSDKHPCRWRPPKHVGTDMILRVPGRLPGLYLIETDDRGERTLQLLARQRARARAVRLARLEQVAEKLLTAKLIYFSGITLSLYSNTGLGRFLARGRNGAVRKA